MKSNKGFTLIELLAVIVVLAVIALIATPLIVNVIDDARKGAERSSAAAYIHALEQDVTLDDALGTGTYSANCRTAGTSCVISTVDSSLVKNSVPKSVTLTVSNGVVMNGSIIVVDEYQFTVNSLTVNDGTVKAK